VCLVAFLRFNRFACVACFNPIEPNSEVNRHHGHQAKLPSKTVLQANTNPEQLSLPRERFVEERIQISTVAGLLGVFATGDGTRVAPLNS